MKRLVFHLGLPRTGTTSIQHFLAERREALRAASILYPVPSGATPQHKNFDSAALNPNAQTAVNHVGMAMELLDTDTNRTDRTGPLPEWGAVLDRMQQDDLETLIVSYENFGLSPRKYDFTRLGERLGGYRRSGVIYLRHPQDWLVSLYEQHIRGKRRGAVPFAEFGQFDRSGGLTAARRLRVTKRTFGLRELTPIDFNRAIKTGGLIPSFLAAAGIADAVAFDGDVHRNAAFAAEQNLFLRECNRRGMSDAAFVWVRQAISNANRLGTPLGELAPGLDMLTPEEREDLARVAAADVADLHDRTDLLLTGPKPVSQGSYRAFTAADFTTILDALRASDDLRPRPTPGIAAEFAALAG